MWLVFAARVAGDFLMQVKSLMAENYKSNCAAKIEELAATLEILRKTKVGILKFSPKVLTRTS